MTPVKIIIEEALVYSQTATDVIFTNNWDGTRRFDRYASTAKHVSHSLDHLSLVCLPCSLAKFSVWNSLLHLMKLKRITATWHSITWQSNTIGTKVYWMLQNTDSDPDFFAQAGQPVPIIGQTLRRIHPSISDICKGFPLEFH